MNQILITGNLTKEPERFGNTEAVAKFGVASNEFDETEFFNIVAFKTLADNCLKYLHKGSKVLVLGRQKTDSYEKDGEPRKRIEILASRIEFLSPKDDKADLPFPEMPGKKPEKPKFPDAKKEPDIPDDLPF